ncbi:MAG: CHAT domain-containing protein [Candidatus Solibacter usitatus]|nr:CHAT domain-containing protein [Candidatus Solibacter usitatus]
MLRSEILLDRGRTAESLACLQELSAVGAAPTPELQAHFWLDLGDAKRRMGDEVESRKLFAQAREVAAAQNLPVLLTRIEIKLATAFSGEEASATAQHALELARSVNDPYWIAQALNVSGYVKMDQLRFDEAITWFEQAESIAQSIGARGVVQQARGNRGFCYHRLGNFDRALVLFIGSEGLAGQMGRQNDRQLWLGDIGNIYLARRDFDRAISYYQIARQVAEQTANRPWVVTWLHNCAWASLGKGDLDAAEQFARQALEAGQGLANPAAEMLTKLGLATIATRRGKYVLAEPAFRELIASSTRQPNIAWEAHGGLAQLYQAQGKASQAEEEYRAAIAVIDKEWLALSDQSKITFLSNIIEFYRAYVGFLAEGKQVERALEIAETSRARLLAQKLEGLSTALPRFQAKDATGLAAASHSILLSYWLAPERSYLWVVSGRGVAQFTLPPEARVQTLVEQHNRAIANLQDPLASGQAAAKQLYDELVAPAAALVPPGSNVIIVPNGRLHDLNFETLAVPGATPHYWIEDVTLAIAPSLAVLKSEAAGKRQKPQLLLLGDPLAADKDYPPLAHVKQEAELVAAHFPSAGSQAFTGAEAYPQKYREAGPQDFTAIHFAAHATANRESPLNSAVILSPHENQYKLYARDILDLPVRADLVTISACRSAGSRTYDGEGLIGFSWAFLQAGARHVVAGLWDVDDAATPMLMDHFYREIAAGQPPEAALRSAQLELMRSNNVFRKPYYWAAFQVFTRYAGR